MEFLASLKLSNYNKHFIIGALFILISVIIFYPAFYTTTDERDYIENSYLVGQGNLVKNDVQCYEGASCGYFNGNGYISKYNLGLSFLLIPIVFLDWRITFFISIIVFISGLYIFKRFLEKRGIRAEFIYLYAFFPTFVYYSRKTMTEVYTITFIMIIFYLLFEKSEGKSKFKKFLYDYRYLIVGALSGITVLLKYSNALFIVPIIIYWLFINFKSKAIGNVGGTISLGFEEKKPRLIRWLKDNLALFIGAFPFLLIFLAINYIFYGSIFHSGYFFSKEEFLIIPSLILPQALKYIIILLIIYPGLPILGLFSKYKHRFLIFGILLISLIFFVGFPGYAFNSGLLDFIFGIRFLIPILGLVILCYSETLNNLLNKIKVKNLDKVIIYTVAVVLIVNMFIMAYILKVRSYELATKSEEIYNKVEEGGNYYTQDIEERKLLNQAFRKGKRWLFVN
ncbi:MAG: glycosyltransferase family 39 protein [Candidatus Dojkabacteria bacterium]